MRIMQLVACLFFAVMLIGACNKHQWGAQLGAAWDAVWTEHGTGEYAAQDFYDACAIQLVGRVNFWDLPISDRRRRTGTISEVCTYLTQYRLEEGVRLSDPSPTPPN